MGTWDEGILDNDTACDGLGDLHMGIIKDIQTLGDAKPSTVSTQELAGAVGVLLQLSPYDFSLDTEGGLAIVAALKAHAGSMAKLVPAARKVLERVMSGEGKALAKRPAPMSRTQIALLNSGKGSGAPFGKREPALFASAPAAAYVQTVARRCVEMVDEDFEDEDNWCDLCREGMGMGGLAVLLVLEPCKVPSAKVKRWRTCAAKGLAFLEGERDEELDFHRHYYDKLDRVFGLLQRKFDR